MNRIKKWAPTVVSWILLGGILISILISFLFFNDKLNRINNEQQKRLSKAGKQAHNGRNTAYDFSKLVLDLNPDWEISYDPSGKYLFLGGSLPDSPLVDEKGVLMTEWGEDKQKLYHPVGILQYALRCFDAYADTKDRVYLDKAIIQANFILDTLMDPKTGMIMYPFDYFVGGTDQTLIAPWGSAMAQGHACSVFSRLYKETGDSKYIDGCHLAMKPLTVSVKDGGLTATFLTSGLPYYEEYPTEKPNYTLNGFMFALIGLYDVVENTGDEMAQQLLDEGMETLIYALPFYDSDGISLYHLAHLHGDVPVHYSTSYHITHIYELKVLSQYRQDDRIDYYINRWISYVEGIV